MKKYMMVLAALAALNGTATSGELHNPARRVIGCEPRRLVAAVQKVAQHFGRPAVAVSGYRSRAHNRAVGGAKNSYHMRCMAIDFYVRGISPWALVTYARRIHGGGVGLYDGRQFIHMDTGPLRQWHWKRR
jgi:uncharacterized protein YcbK (DUF882 family)